MSDDLSDEAAKIWFGSKTGFVDEVRETEMLMWRECRRRAEAQIEKAHKAAREMVAEFMIDCSLATGHGDTIEDLLKEAKWQIQGLCESIEKCERDAFTAGYMTTVKYPHVMEPNELDEAYRAWRGQREGNGR